jgi:hypothetical protein
MMMVQAHIGDASSSNRQLALQGFGEVILCKAHGKHDVANKKQPHHLPEACRLGEIQTAAST